MLLNTRYSLALLFAAPSFAQNWSTYPQVPKTASINGFADPIYSDLPECAQSCVRESVDNTPCPYWDTGCLCIMPQWINPVADCFAKNCKGEQVADASSLADGLCKRVGAWWNIGAAESTALSGAIGDANASPATSTAASSESATSSAPSASASATPESSASQTGAAVTSTDAAASTQAAATGASSQTAKAAASEAASQSASAKASSSKAQSAAAEASKGASSSAPPLSNGGAVAGVAAVGAAMAFVAHLL